MKYLVCFAKQVQNVVDADFWISGVKLSYMFTAGWLGGV